MCKAIYVLTGGSSVGKTTTKNAMPSEGKSQLKFLSEIATEILEEGKINPKITKQLHAFQLEINKRLIAREMTLRNCKCKWNTVVDRDLVDALVYTAALPSLESAGHSRKQARSIRRKLNETRRLMKWLVRQRQAKGTFRAIFFFEPLGAKFRNGVTFHKDLQAHTAQMNPVLSKGFSTLMPNAKLVLVPSRTKESGAKKALAALPGTDGALIIDACDGATRSRLVKPEERAREILYYIALDAVADLEFPASFGAKCEVDKISASGVHLCDVAPGPDDEGSGPVFIKYKLATAK